jgi:hypothetical protein
MRQKFIIFSVIFRPKENNRSCIGLCNRTNDCSALLTAVSKINSLFTVHKQNFVG